MNQAGEAPTNVYLHLRDGTRIGPLALHYQGTDTEGIHVWCAIAPGDLSGRAREVTVDTLPARTTVTVEFR